MTAADTPPWLGCLQADEPAQHDEKDAAAKGGGRCVGHLKFSIVTNSWVPWQAAFLKMLRIMVFELHKMVKAGGHAPLLNRFFA